MNHDSADVWGGVREQQAECNDDSMRLHATFVHYTFYYWLVYPAVSVVTWWTYLVCCQRSARFMHSLLLFYWIYTYAALFDLKRNSILISPASPFISTVAAHETIMTKDDDESENHGRFQGDKRKYSTCCPSFISCCNVHVMVGLMLGLSQWLFSGWWYGN